MLPSPKFDLSVHSLDEDRYEDRARELRVERALRAISGFNTGAAYAPRLSFGNGQRVQHESRSRPPGRSRVGVSPPTLSTIPESGQGGQGAATACSVRCSETMTAFSERVGRVAGSNNSLSNCSQAAAPKPSPCAPVVNRGFTWMGRIDAAAPHSGIKTDSGIPIECSRSSAKSSSVDHAPAIRTFATARSEDGSEDAVRTLLGQLVGIGLSNRLGRFAGDGFANEGTRTRTGPSPARDTASIQRYYSESGLAEPALLLRQLVQAMPGADSRHSGKHGAHGAHGTHGAHGAHGARGAHGANQVHGAPAHEAPEMHGGHGVREVHGIHGPSSMRSPSCPAIAARMAPENSPDESCDVRTQHAPPLRQRTTTRLDAGGVMRVSGVRPTQPVPTSQAAAPAPQKLPGGTAQATPWDAMAECMADGSGIRKLLKNGSQPTLQNPQDAEGIAARSGSGDNGAVPASKAAASRLSPRARASLFGL